MSLNRKTEEAAIRQVNFARLGSLVHDNGAQLDVDSLPYLEKLKEEIHKWSMAVDSEIRRVGRPSYIKARETWGSGDKALRMAAQLMPIIVAGIIWTGPKLTPQQAADVLRPHQFVAQEVGTGPKVIVIPSTPGAVSWLAFPPPTPARRLDGTLLSQPVIVYGGGYGRTHETTRQAIHPSH